jgi:hypothetical protein
LIDPFKAVQKPFKELKNMKEFKSSFKEICMSENIGKYMIKVAFEMNKNMKQKLVVAGGAIYSSLTRVDHKFIVGNDRSPPDIDIFLIENGCPPEESEIIIKSWLLKVQMIYNEKYPKNAIGVNEEYQKFENKQMEENECPSEEELKIFEGKSHEFIICRDINNTISVVPVNKRKIQIVLRRISTIEELLLFFDLDCARFAYDGETLFTIREGLRSFVNEINIVPAMHRVSGMYFARAIQYGNRGMDTTFVDLHPLEHLDADFRNSKGLKLKMAFLNPKPTEDGEGYYVVSPNLEYSEFLEIYIKGVENFVGELDTNWGIRDRTGFGKSFKGIIALEFDELFKMNAENAFTEGYRDNHLYNKYLISKCYLCGLYRQLYIQPCSNECENTDEENDEHEDDYAEFPELHSFCSTCFKLNESFKSITRDLTSKIAIVTGGRIKIGHSVALKLLRCNCKVIVTSRFPTDALEKYQKETDYESFKDRLIIYPLDMKNAELILGFISK